MRTPFVVLASLISALAAVSPPSVSLAERDGEKYVFAHFIVGIVASYAQSDWETDMNLAKSIGIDAFALNIGKDTYNYQQLGFAYAAAANFGFKVFISFDFAYWNSGDVSTMATYLQTYATEPGQFMYNGAAFVSSFVGDGYPYRTLESQSGIKLSLWTYPRLVISLVLVDGNLPLIATTNLGQVDLETRCVGKSSKSGHQHVVHVNGPSLKPRACPSFKSSSPKVSFKSSSGCPQAILKPSSTALKSPSNHLQVVLKSKP
ncbi:glycosyl hydrolase family 71-domain-containing protein [Mycena olivaceomarginata]|nr:glycosyl hydrolase family 71-domain-containing protein [Mycena olivaceomarginata]